MYKLPFSDQPMVICYQNLAYPLGIIEGNAKLLNEDITPWVIATYTNPFFSQTASNHYDICVFDNWGTHEAILLHQNINIFKRTYYYLGVNIVKDVCTMIKEGCYVSGIYNEKYIPGKKSYQNRDFNHDYLLYGVDEARKVFISAGYLADGRYQSFEIPFSSYEQALNSVIGNQMQFNLWSYNHHYRFKKNDERVLRSLNDYRESTTSYDFKREIYYGMEANRKLKEYFILVNNSNNPTVDLRYTRAYMEHKYMLNLSIKYLFETTSINSKVDADIVNCANEIYQNAIMIHRLGIKFRLYPQGNMMDRISGLFEKNEMLELRILDKSLSIK